MSRKRKLAQFNAEREPANLKHHTGNKGYDTDFAVPQLLPNIGKKRKTIDPPSSDDDQSYGGTTNNRGKVPAKTPHQAVTKATKEPRKSQAKIQPAQHARDKRDANAGYQTEVAESRPKRTIVKKKKFDPDSSSSDAESFQEAPKTKTTARQRSTLEQPKQNVASKAPRASTSAVDNFDKILKESNNAKIVQLFETHILGHVNNPAGPAQIKLGEVIGKTTKNGVIELWVESLEFHGKSKSEKISFEVTKMIDYQIVLNKKHPEQIRPKARFLFITGIQVLLSQSSKKLNLSCHLNVVPVISQPTYKKDRVVQEAIGYLKLQFSDNKTP